MKTELQTRPLTAVEFRRLCAEGVFKEDERVELIEGEIVPMVPPGPDHIWAVNYIADVFAPLAARHATILHTQNPIALDNLSMPQPDVALLVRPERGAKKVIPRAEDVLLAIEVANTSLKEDRDHKIPLYGRRGIRESWLVDLNAGVVTAYRIPSAKGYLEEKRFVRGQKLAPEAFPDFEVAVDDLLG
jgi:Uma2 family endonuclease